MRQQIINGVFPSKPKATSWRCHRDFFTQCTQPDGVKFSDLAVKREIRLAMFYSLTAIIGGLIARQGPQACIITTCISTVRAARLCRL